MVSGKVSLLVDCTANGDLFLLSINCVTTRLLHLMPKLLFYLHPWSGASTLLLQKHVHAPIFFFFCRDRAPVCVCVLMIRCLRFFSRKVFVSPYCKFLDPPLSLTIVQCTFTTVRGDFKTLPPVDRRFHPVVIV